MAAQWEYCELHYVYGSVPVEKIKAELHTFGGDGMVTRVDKYHMLMAELGRGGWELASSYAVLVPGLSPGTRAVTHTFRRQAQ